MPYKDPERKRQWEREHREQRNAARRKQRMTEGSGQRVIPRLMADPDSSQQSGNGWKALASIAIGIGVVLLAAVAGVNPPPPDDLAGSPI
jgi:ferric-dicitrate binding protein FerR (iron transport regulator)